MAPELVSDPTRVSEKADVWSLGMVLWEMLTLQVPFNHLSPQQIVAGLMVGNLQPEVRALRPMLDSVSFLPPLLWLSASLVVCSINDLVW